MSDFKWTSNKEKAVILLAQAHTQSEVADMIGVSRMTICRWLTNIEFVTERDRLSLMMGIASRAERLRIAMRVVKAKTENGEVTEKDLLDWLKFAQSETDGVKLDLTALSEAKTSLAD